MATEALKLSLLVILKRCLDIERGEAPTTAHRHFQADHKSDRADRRRREVVKQSSLLSASLKHISHFPANISLPHEYALATGNVGTRW